VQVAGLRYYNPGLGRWTARDPIEERGGTNLNSFVANHSTSLVDAHGESAAMAGLAMALGLLYGDRAIAGLTIPGNLYNRTHRGFAVPGSIIAGDERARAVVDPSMDSHVARVCASSPGVVTLVGFAGQVTFDSSVAAAAIIGTSTLTETPRGVLTRDSACPSCKRYLVESLWEFSDTIDWWNIHEINSRGASWASPLTWLEATSWLVGDIVLAAEFDVYGFWEERRGGCCP
jgi:hypothetical protein